MHVLLWANSLCHGCQQSGWVSACQVSSMCLCALIQVKSQTLLYLSLQLQRLFLHHTFEVLQNHSCIVLLTIKAMIGKHFFFFFNQFDMFFGRRVAIAQLWESECVLGTNCCISQARSCFAWGQPSATVLGERPWLKHFWCLLRH